MRKLLALAVICLSALNASARDCPFVPETFPRLALDARVTVRFEPADFTPEELAALNRGLDSWRPHLPKEMTVTTLLAPREACEGCVSVVREQPLSPGDSLAEADKSRAYPEDSSLLYTALVRVRPDQHRPDVLEALMAHEFGHLLGLGDSETEGFDRRTVMGHFRRRSFFFLKSYRPEAKGPTPCDAANVAEIYKGVVRAPRTAVATDEQPAASGADAEAKVERVGFAAVASPLFEKVFAGERETVEALKRYRFKREVLFETLDKEGRANGTYRRVSLMLVADDGSRVEKVLEFPKPTLKRLRLTQEDVEDFAGAMMLGLDPFHPERYVLGYGDGHIKIAPLNLPEAEGRGYRVFSGSAQLDAEGRVVKVEGQALPEGSQRFPRFTATRREVGGLLFPSEVHGEDVLRFGNGLMVRVRVTIRFSDYQKFRSSVAVVEEEEAGEQ